jgi:crotonobetainyl-CoA:carnitine CoA-transferase CaiB-like acyl-CoA transferase
VRQPFGHDTDDVLAALSGALGPTPDAAVTEPPMSGAAPPLEGTRVLDLTRAVAGPTAARILGQLGADVIKIDTDLTNFRAGLPEPVFHEHSNRAKRSMALDLKDDDDAELFRRLVATADVVITNFAGDAPRRLRIDEASLRAVQSDLVYVYLNAFGTSGPRALDRGYAETANTVTGVTERAIDPNRPSGPPANIDWPRWAFTDYAAGVVGAFAALVGFYARARGGGGQRVETSLVRAAGLEQVTYMIDYEGKRWGEPHGPMAPGWGALQRLYQTADGWIFLGATREQLRALADALDLAIDPGDTDDRHAAVLGAALATRSTADCLERVHAAGAGAAPVQTVEDVMGPDGPADRRGMRLQEATEEFGTVVMLGRIATLHRTPMRSGPFTAPFGSHRAEVIADLA